MPQTLAGSEERRLESWKEIAAHLKRDIRTVKRWEAYEGLPVHRHHHLARSTVYAYPTELDAWRFGRRPEHNPIVATWASRPFRAMARAPFILLALLMSGGYTIRPAIGGAQQGELATRRIWAGSGASSVSPDGRYLSYVDAETGDLAVRDLVTNESRRVTTSGSWQPPVQFAESSTISPDGDSIAYAWYNEHANYELRLVARSGGAPRVLYRNDEMRWVRPYGWSPDRKHIVALVSANGPKHQLVLVSAVDGSVRVLKTFDWRRPGKAALSPNGRFLAYDFPPLEDARERDVFLLAIDGGHETPLVRHPANDFLLGWFPDGGGLLFASDRTGANAAWAIRVTDGQPPGEPTLVKADLGGVLGIGFTVRGDYYYALTTSMSDVYVARLDSTTGDVVAGPDPLRIRYQEQKSFAQWSPDGEQLAYLMQRPPSVFMNPATVSILTIRTGQVRDLPLRMSFANRVTWMPDGRSVIVGGRDLKGQQVLGRVDLSTGYLNPIVHGARRAEVSPDGRTIFYESRRPGTGAVIVARDVASARESVVYPHEATFALSPDGRWLALKGATPGGMTSVTIRIMPASGGESRTVLRLDESDTNDHERLAWSRDGRFLFHVGAGNEVWRIPVQMGSPQKLKVTVPEVTRLSVHPDGKRIAFSAGYGKTEVWAMENLSLRY